MEAISEIRWSKALEGLDAATLRDIESRLTRKELSAGTPLFYQGTRADSLFIIQSGRVRLFQYTSSGKEYSSGVWSKGYLIGLISTILGGDRFVNAQAVDHTSLLVLDRTNLLHCMKTIPAFALNISYLLALLANDSIRRAVPLALDSVDIKLGRALLKLAILDEASQAFTISGITQEELATMVGASRPWVNRTLSAFEKQGLIHRNKHIITLINIGHCKEIWLGTEA
ncbi:Cyclic AMP receptor protein [Castellaniella caeni]